MQKSPCRDSIYLKIKAKSDVLSFCLCIEKICMGHPKQNFTFYWYYFWVHCSTVKSSAQIQEHSSTLNTLQKEGGIFSVFLQECVTGMQLPCT